MPATPHVEKHFTATETVRDVVIGMADGLTVPFALAAGLAAAVSSTKLIVTAGLAEIVAGAIAMGLGGYLAARTDAEHYGSERTRENWEIENLRDTEVQEVTEIFLQHVPPALRPFLLATWKTFTPADLPKPDVAAYHKHVRLRTEL